MIQIFSLGKEKPKLRHQQWSGISQVPFERKNPFGDSFEIERARELYKRRNSAWLLESEKRNQKKENGKRV